MNNVFGFLICVLYVTAIAVMAEIAWHLAIGLPIR